MSSNASSITWKISDMADGGRARADQILYIEDDAFVGKLVARRLGDDGFEVDIAVDGESGLARLAEGGVDLLLIDHNLPGMSGIEVLKLSLIHI